MGRISIDQGAAALRTLTDLLMQEDLLSTNVANALERLEDALEVIRDRQRQATRAPRRFTP